MPRKDVSGKDEIDDFKRLEIAQKIERFRRLKAQGLHINRRLVQSNAFRNPNLVHVLARHFEIDQFGSNLLSSQWPIKMLLPSSDASIEVIERKIQKNFEAAEERRRLDKRRRIDFETANCDDQKSSKRGTSDLEWSISSHRSRSNHDVSHQMELLERGGAGSKKHR